MKLDKIVMKSSENKVDKIVEENSNEVIELAQDNHLYDLLKIWAPSMISVYESNKMMLYDAINRLYGIIVSGIKKIYLTFVLFTKVISPKSLESTASYVTALASRVKEKLKMSIADAISWIKHILKQLYDKVNTHPVLFRFLSAFTIAITYKSACERYRVNKAELPKILQDYKDSIINIFKVMLFGSGIGEVIGTIIANTVQIDVITEFMRPCQYIHTMTDSDKVMNENQKLNIHPVDVNVETDTDAEASLTETVNSELLVGHIEEQSQTKTTMDSHFGILYIAKRGDVSDAEVLVVCASNKKRDWTDIVVTNHVQICNDLKHSYEYWQCDKISERNDLRQWQWLKIDLLRKVIERLGSETKYVLWIDDDIMMASNRLGGKSWITNLIDSKLRSYMKTTMLISRDAGDTNQVNTGLMIFNVTPNIRDSSIQLLNLIWDEGEKNNQRLAFCKNQTCLHEQQALNDIIANTSWRSKISVMNPRENKLNFNTFCRKSHYDENRHIYLEYNDSKDFEYKPGDITAHATGLKPTLRLNMLKWLKKSMDGNTNEPGCRNLRL